MNDIGKSLKRIRGKETQSEFAERIGISRSYLGDLENNRKNPSVETLSKIANKLDISLNELLYGDIPDKILNFLLVYIQNNLHTRFHNTNSMFTNDFYEFSELSQDDLYMIAKNLSIDMTSGNYNDEYTEELEELLVENLHNYVISEIYKKKPTTDRLASFTATQVFRIMLEINELFSDKHGNALPSVDEKMFQSLKTPLKDIMKHVSEYFENKDEL